MTVTTGSHFFAYNLFLLPEIATFLQLQHHYNSKEIKKQLYET